MWWAQMPLCKTRLWFISPQKYFQDTADGEKGHTHKFWLLFPANLHTSVSTSRLFIVAMILSLKTGPQTNVQLMLRYVTEICISVSLEGNSSLQQPRWKAASSVCIALPPLWHLCIIKTPAFRLSLLPLYLKSHSRDLTMDAHRLRASSCVHVCSEKTGGGACR